MVYYIMSNDKSDEMQKKIVSFLRDNFDAGEIRLINPKRQHIIEEHISFICKDDIVLWHPVVANDNLELVKSYQSAVILIKRTILVQKHSKHNPVTENMAINNGFKIMYVDPEFREPTNEDYALVLSENYYVTTPQLIKQNNKI